MSRMNQMKTQMLTNASVSTDDVYNKTYIFYATLIEIYKQLKAKTTVHQTIDIMLGPSYLFQK